MGMLNSIVAVLSLIGGLLCARAFLPHVKLLGNRRWIISREAC